MEKQDRKLEALKEQVLAAYEEPRFSAELIKAIAAHCRKRRAEGRTPGFIAQELGITAWQVADWSHQAAREEEESPDEEDRQKAPLTFTLKIPLTYRFERLLGREIAASMKKCDSCCWKQFLKSLPGDFRVEKGDEE